LTKEIGFRTVSGPPLADPKCETRPGGQPDGSSHMALGWMGARAKYSLRGGNYRSHIVRSHKTSATFKASERFFWIRRPLHSASAWLTQSGLAAKAFLRKWVSVRSKKRIK